MSQYRCSVTAGSRALHPHSKAATAVRLFAAVVGACNPSIYSIYYFSSLSIESETIRANSGLGPGPYGEP